ERDAAGLALGARARAARLNSRRPAAALAAPLVGLSLERSLSLAEAMEARGYGGGTRTRSPRGRTPGWERVLLAIAIGMAAVVAVAAPADGYRYYDLLDDPFTATGIATASAILLLGAASIGAVWQARRPG